MNGKLVYAVSVLTLLAGCAPAGSQEVKPETKPDPQKQTEPASESCSHEVYRQLDFWVGEWDLQWTNADGSTSTGRNTISRSPYGNCVITENFDGAPGIQFKGMSVSTYDKFSQQWRQTWVDDQGGYYALSGGPNEDGTFTLTTTRLGDKGPHSRMVWSEIKPDSLTWSWQGRKQDETEWKDNWVIKYTRK